MTDAPNCSLQELIARAEAFMRQGWARETLSACQEALALDGGNAALHALSGAALLLQQETDPTGEGERHLRAALRLDPLRPDAHANLATLDLRHGRLDEAEIHLRRALESQSLSAGLHSQLGTALQRQLLLDQAVVHKQRALELDPFKPGLHTDLLFWRNFLNWPSAAENLAAHSAWEAQHAASIRPKQGHANSPDPERALRVGIPSADLRAHPAAIFLLGLFAHHDRHRMTITAYCDAGTHDEVTERLRAGADVWCETGALDDASLARLIEEHGIDVLVDTTGHASRHRLLTFARKPAPVQVAHMGYANTRGLSAIDYWLTDALANPPDSQAAFVERLWIMPGCHANYTPPRFEVPVAPPPVLADPAGTVTFGCFNNGAKISRRCVATWAQVLLAVPNSRLFLRGLFLGIPEARRTVLAGFRAAGVSADRINFEGYSDKPSYLQDYGRIDIALDPFPNNGMTTTLDTLWMGVPVVALAGNTAVSRYGLTLLTHLGHPEWVAATEADYVRIAAGLAAGPARLAAIRQNLRTELLASSLCDGPGFARRFEDALRGMWRLWCASRG